MIKVCYFTSKFSTDTRIFEKECTSLVKKGYDVHLVCPNISEETKNGVHITGVKYNKKGDLNRFLLLPRLLYKKAIDIDADIYHFNDPASLPYGAKLKKKGKKVIFDSFEDHPTLLFEKKKIPKFILKIIIRIYTLYEFRQCKKFDGVLCCYHWTLERLEKACDNTRLVLNFPIFKDKVIVKHNGNQNTICYAGLIAHGWNIDTIIDSLEKLEYVKLNLAGWGDERLIAKMKTSAGWKKVNFMGKLSRKDVVEKIFMQSNIGMALLDYLPLCKGKIGNLSNNKLFEYMMMGLPVICTDFLLWKEVVEKNNCGLCISPRNQDEIVKAVKYLLSNPKIAEKMGQNGRQAVRDKYNWETQERIMFEVYTKILN